MALRSDYDRSPESRVKRALENASHSLRGCMEQAEEMGDLALVKALTAAWIACVQAKGLAEKHSEGEL